MTRFHANLETSRRYFPMICTSHTYQDKIDNILRAKEAGLQVCSGGILGMGESWEDRIDMALSLGGAGDRLHPAESAHPHPRYSTGAGRADFPGGCAAGGGPVPVHKSNRLDPYGGRPGSISRWGRGAVSLRGQCRDYRGYADHHWHQRGGRYGNGYPAWLSIRTVDRERKYGNQNKE